MVDPIRVLFDATPLASGVTAGVGRAGIFRVAQSLLAAAIHQPDLHVDIAGLDSYFADIQLARYVRTDTRFAPHTVSAWAHLGATRDDSISTLDALTALGEDHEAARRLRGLIALRNRTARPVPVLGPYDVYHSLRHPLAGPDRVAARCRALFIHDLIPLRFPDWAGEGFARAVRNVIASVDVDRDWIICNSICTRDDVCATIGIDPRRVAVTPLAADRAIFHPIDDDARITDVRARHGIGPHPYLLSVATLEPRKNLAHLVRAFARLIDILPADDDLRLVLVGATGWKTAEVFDTLASLGRLGARVHVVGYISDADLAPLYSGADAFIYPSHFEGFGLPVLEAMQCGTPVVTTTGGALPEVVGDAGVLVNPTDMDELVEGIRRARRSLMLGRRGLERAKIFSWAATLRLTMEVYREMLS